MRRLLLAAATLAIAFPLLASDATAPKSTGAPVPLLWKVSDKDNTVYLLGSFHMLTKDDYPLSKDIDAAYADAEEVVFELPPEEMLSKDLGLAMTKAAIRTDGTTLDDELPPAQRARLAQWLQDNDATLRQMGLQPAMFQMVDAWYASLLVTIAEARAAGFDSELGLDAHLGKQATADGKRTSGLEGGMKQLAMFESMDKQVQLQLMAESLDETEGGKAALQRLHAQWRERRCRPVVEEARRRIPRRIPGALQDDQQRSQRGVGAAAAQAPRRAGYRRHVGRGRCAAPARQGRRGRTHEGAGLHGRARLLGVREAVSRAWPP